MSEVGLGDVFNGEVLPMRDEVEDEWDSSAFKLQLDDVYKTPWPVVDASVWVHKIGFLPPASPKRRDA